MVRREVLKTPVFWVMYVMFVMVGAGGLMAIAQLAPIAKDFKIDNIPVSILGLTLPALTFALTIDRVLNGICRPFFGWVSDQIGRENTMFIAFLLEGIGIYALLYFANNPVLFVILSGVVFFAWGEIYSLFPATCTDIYGRKFATTNYGMLYTAKGTASLLVPLANVLTAATGSWHAVFYVAASSTSSPRSWRWWCSSRCASRSWRRAESAPNSIEPSAGPRGRLFLRRSRQAARRRALRRGRIWHIVYQS